MPKIPIIMVDDDDLERYIMSRAIHESGLECEIHEFTAGDHFLEVFSDTSRYTEMIGKDALPASVLLDINMPRMDGFEVLEKIAELRNEGHLLPDCFFLLMVTSSNSDADRKTAGEYNFVKEYMVKPLNVESLKSVLNKYYDI